MARAKVAQEAKAVEAGAVPVFPNKAKRVIADLFDVIEHNAAARMKANGSMMSLTHSAGTKTAQHFVRVDTLVTVSPIDFERVRISRSAKLDGLGAWP